MAAARNLKIVGRKYRIERYDSKFIFETDLFDIFKIVYEYLQCGSIISLFNDETEIIIVKIIIKHDNINHINFHLTKQNCGYDNLFLFYEGYIDPYCKNKALDYQNKHWYKDDDNYNDDSHHIW